LVLLAFVRPDAREPLRPERALEELRRLRPLAALRRGVDARLVASDCVELVEDVLVAIAWMLPPESFGVPPPFPSRAAG
jgi:hypothetical protein